MALHPSWYGYKNSRINARLVPFHRIMSMEIITFAASLLYLREETKEETVKLAADFLKYQQDNNFDVGHAYQWLEDHKTRDNGRVIFVDFIKMVSEEMKLGDSMGWIRLFYTLEEDFRYGSHAAHLNGSKDTSKIEDKAGRNITTLLKESMRFYFENNDLELDELCDDMLDNVLCAGYTQRGTRKATSDYFFSEFPNMPEEIKRMLVEQKS